MKYFPIATCRVEYPAWTVWSVIFPMARFAVIDPKPDELIWIHPDQIPAGARVIAIGIPGIRDDVAVRWMMSDHRPTPDEVRDAMVAV